MPLTVYSARRYEWSFWQQTAPRHTPPQRAVGHVATQESGPVPPAATPCP